MDLARRRKEDLIISNRVGNRDWQCLIPPLRWRDPLSPTPTRGNQLLEQLPICALAES